MPGGRPEGYVEGFANLYCDAAELIAARRAGRKPRPAAAAMTPNVLDGARGIAFIEASVASSHNDGRGPLHGSPRITSNVPMPASTRYRRSRSCSISNRRTSPRRLSRAQLQ